MLNQAARNASSGSGSLWRIWAGLVPKGRSPEGRKESRLIFVLSFENEEKRRMETHLSGGVNSGAEPTFAREKPAPVTDIYPHSSRTVPILKICPQLTLFEARSKKGSDKHMVAACEAGCLDEPLLACYTGNREEPRTYQLTSSVPSPIWPQQARGGLSMPAVDD